MVKTKRCPCLRTSGSVATCGAQYDLDKIENGSGTCPKKRGKYGITQTCWKVPHVDDNAGTGGSGGAGKKKVRK